MRSGRSQAGISARKSKKDRKEAKDAAPQSSYAGSQCPLCQEQMFSAEDAKACKVQATDFPINKTLLLVGAGVPGFRGSLERGPSKDGDMARFAKLLGVEGGDLLLNQQQEDEISNISFDYLGHYLKANALETQTWASVEDQARAIKTKQRTQAQQHEVDATAAHGCVDSAMSSAEKPLVRQESGDDELRRRGPGRAQADRKIENEIEDHCQTHLHKKMEAFCEDCSAPVCMDCILTQDHKGHEIVNIQTGSSRQRAWFEEKMKAAIEKKAEVEHQIIRTRSHLQEIEKEASDRRRTLSTIFNDVRQKIVEREELLKKRIAVTLDSERTLFKQKIQNLEDQLRYIAEMKQEKQKMISEPDILVLLGSKLRQELAAEANKRVPAGEFKDALPEIRKEDEIACIVKKIVPGSLRPSLLSSTLTSSIRRKQAQEDIRKQELQVQQKQMQQILNGGLAPQVLTQLQFGPNQLSNIGHQTYVNIKSTSKKHRSFSGESQNQSGFASSTGQDFNFFKLSQQQTLPSKIMAKVGGDSFPGESDITAQKNKTALQQSMTSASKYGDISKQKAYASEQQRQASYNIKRKAKESQTSPKAKLQGQHGAGSKHLRKGSNSQLYIMTQDRNRRGSQEQVEADRRATSKEKPMLQHLSPSNLTGESSQVTNLNALSAEQVDPTSGEGLLGPGPIGALETGGELGESGEVEEAADGGYVEIKDALKMKHGAEGNTQIKRKSYQPPAAHHRKATMTHFSNSSSKPIRADKLKGFHSQNAHNSSMSLRKLEHSKPINHSGHGKKNFLASKATITLEDDEVPPKSSREQKKSTGPSGARLSTASPNLSMSREHQQALTQRRTNRTQQSSRMEQPLARGGATSREEPSRKMALDKAQSSNGKKQPGRKEKEAAATKSGLELQRTPAKSESNDKREKDSSAAQAAQFPDHGPLLLEELDNGATMTSKGADMNRKIEDQLDSQPSESPNKILERSQKAPEHVEKVGHEALEPGKTMQRSQTHASQRAGKGSLEAARHHAIDKHRHVGAQPRPSSKQYNIQYPGKSSNICEGHHRSTVSTYSVSKLQTKGLQSFKGSKGKLQVQKDKKQSLVSSAHTHALSTAPPTATNTHIKEAHCAAPSNMSTKIEDPTKERDVPINTDETDSIDKESQNGRSPKDKQKAAAPADRTAKNTRNSDAQNEIRRTERHEEEVNFDSQSPSRGCAQGGDGSGEGYTLEDQQLLTEREEEHMESTVHLQGDQRHQPDIAEYLNMVGGRHTGPNLRPEKPTSSQLQHQSSKDRQGWNKSSNSKSATAAAPSRPARTSGRDVQLRADATVDKIETKNRHIQRKTQTKSRECLLNSKTEQASRKLSLATFESHTQSQYIGNEVDAAVWGGSTPDKALQTKLGATNQQKRHHQSESGTKKIQMQLRDQQSQKVAGTPQSKASPELGELESPGKEQVKVAACGLGGQKKVAKLRAVQLQKLNEDTSLRSKDKMIINTSKQQSSSNIVGAPRARQRIQQVSKKDSPNSPLRTLITCSDAASPGQAENSKHHNIEFSQLNVEQSNLKRRSEIISGHRQYLDGIEEVRDEEQKEPSSSRRESCEVESAQRPNQQEDVEAEVAPMSESPMPEGDVGRRQVAQQSCISNGTGGVGFGKKGMEPAVKVRPPTRSEQSAGKPVAKKQLHTLTHGETFKSHHGKGSPYSWTSLKKALSPKDPRDMVELLPSAGGAAKVRAPNQALKRLTLPTPLSSLEHLRSKRQDKSRQLLTAIPSSVSTGGLHVAGRSTHVPPGPPTATIQQMKKNYQTNLQIMIEGALPKSKAASTHTSLTQLGSRAAVKPDLKPTRLYHKLEKPDAMTKNPRPNNPTRKANNQKQAGADASTITQSPSLTHNQFQRGSLRVVTAQNEEEQLKSPSRTSSSGQNPQSDARSAMETNKSAGPRYDYSAIFNVQEEYIFVFSGASSSNGQPLESVEVFDVQQEIWRIFDNKVCNGRSKFAAVSFFTGGLKNSEKNPSIQQDIIHLVGGIDEHESNLSKVDEFNFKDMKTFEADWRLPVNLSAFGRCQSCSNQVFIAGGSTQEADSDECRQEKKVYQIFCAKKPKMEEANLVELGSVAGSDLCYQLRQLPDLLEEREDFALVLDRSSQANDFCLLAIGGYNASKGISSAIEKYDSKIGYWERVSSLAIEGSRGLRAHQAVALPDGIYIIGGFDGSNYLNTLWKLDPATFKLQALPPMNVERAHFSAVLSQNCGHIYVIGGYNSQSGALKSVERFDVLTQTWALVAPMHKKRFMHASHSCLTTITSNTI